MHKFIRGLVHSVLGLNTIRRNRSFFSTFIGQENPEALRSYLNKKMVKKRSKKNKQSIKKSNVEDRTEKNKNFMHLFLLPFSLSENMLNFCNNFFIIITFYLLFFLPIFYKYIREDKEWNFDFDINSKLESEMASLIKEKEVIEKKAAFIFDFFCFLMLYYITAPITEKCVGMISSTELQVLLVTILSITLFWLKRVGTPFSRFDPFGRIDPYFAIFLSLITIFGFVCLFVLFMKVAISMLSAPNWLVLPFLYKPENTLDILISILLWRHVHILMKLYYSAVLSELKRFFIYIIACENISKKIFLDMKPLIHTLTFFLLWFMVDILFKDLDSFLGKRTIYSVLFKYFLFKLNLAFMIPYFVIIKNLILVLIRSPLVSMFTAAIFYKLVIKFFVYAKRQLKEYFLDLNEILLDKREHKHYYDSLEAKQIKTFKDLSLKKFYQGLLLNPLFVEYDIRMVIVFIFDIFLTSGHLWLFFIVFPFYFVHHIFLVLYKEWLLLFRSQDVMELLVRISCSIHDQPYIIKGKKRYIKFLPETLDLEKDLKLYDIQIGYKVYKFIVFMEWQWAPFVVYLYNSEINFTIYNYIKLITNCCTFIKENDIYINTISFAGNYNFRRLLNDYGYKGGYKGYPEQTVIGYYELRYYEIQENIIKIEEVILRSSSI